MVEYPTGLKWMQPSGAISRLLSVAGNYAPWCQHFVIKSMIKLGYNAFCHWLNECHQSTKYRVEVKLLPMAKLHYVRLFPGLLSIFFCVNWKWNFRTSKLASGNRRIKQRFENMLSALIYVIMRWTKTKSSKKKQNGQSKV